jgi:flagellar protein FlaG
MRTKKALTSKVFPLLVDTVFNYHTNSCAEVVMAIGPLQGVDKMPAPHDRKEKIDTGPAEKHAAPASVTRVPTAEPRKETDAAKLGRQLETARQQFDDFMERYAIKMRISIDQESKQVVVKVLHAKSDQLIRQIPTEEALRLSKALDAEQGLIIQQKA